MTSWVDSLTGDPIATTGTGYQAITSATTVTLTKLYPTKIGMTFTAAGQSLRLWPAETFSVGQSFVVYNLGAETFTIKDNSGTNTITTAQTGTTYLLTLTDNDTDDGAWIATPVGGAGTGTVTSVAVTLPNIFSVSGSPITTSGTIAATLVTQTANTVFAGPTSGGAATPAFRALVASDYVTMVGDSGAGGTKGAVPAPAAGDAAAGKYLDAGGGWSTPGGSGASTSNSYVVMSAAADLSSERIATAGSGITITDGGAGAAVTFSLTYPTPNPAASALRVMRVNASANAYELTDSLTDIARVATGTSAADTLVLSAYDVNGGSYTDMMTLTANDDPTLTMRQVSFSTTSGIIGTTTNDSAAAGSVGELLSSSVASGAAVALATGVPSDIASISLTAGDWDVWVNATIGGDAATTVTGFAAYVSETSATIDTTTPGARGAYIYNGNNVLNLQPTIVTGPIRKSLAGTTTIYFVVNGTFAGGAANAFGIIQARRRR